MVVLVLILLIGYLDSWRGVNGSGIGWLMRKGVGMRPCDESIKSTLLLVDKMLDLADEGDHVREDNGCGVLYSVVRDSAYKIRQLAEAEREVHIKKGWWK